MQARYCSRDLVVFPNVSLLVVNWIMGTKTHQILFQKLSVKRRSPKTFEKTEVYFLLLGTATLRFVLNKIKRSSININHLKYTKNLNYLRYDICFVFPQMTTWFYLSEGPGYLLLSPVGFRLSSNGMETNFSNRLFVFLSFKGIHWHLT